VKSAFPAIQDPRYLTALQRQAAELATQGDNPVFEVVSRSWLSDVVREEPAAMPPRSRNGIEWILNLATWMDIHRPRLRLS
jgi:asparagine synthase (glutamine-hydrolysing)